MADTTATTVTKQPVPNNRPNGVEALRRYFRESRIELRKVTWPTREQTTNLTIVVVVVCIAIALFLGATDFVFVQFIQWISTN